jgi:hypothetical protein
MSPYQRSVEAFHQDCTAAGILAPEVSELKSRLDDRSSSDHLHVVVYLAEAAGRRLAIYEVTGQENRTTWIERVYTKDELAQYRHIIVQARTLWLQRVDEFDKSGEITGSAVIGAGIEVNTLFGRERIPRMRMILSAPSHLQGSLSWETSLPEILDFLRMHGICCQYQSGMMS